MNDHFSSIGSKLASKIRNLYPNRNSIKQPSQFKENEFVFQPIEESYVYGVLNNLKTNKAVGLDKISARLLKDSSSVITPILTKLFNRSLISSTFPSTWKSGKVTALFKSGDQSNASNYRPITILPTIRKVLEKAVHSQVYRYLIDNKILAPRQFGFRPKISTEIALAHFTDTILANMDKGLVAGAVFLDLAKAFDTVDHSLLFEKLALSGLSNDSVDWFKSYLTNRNQLTALANTVSSFKHVPVGVPQGSVLGPLLFLIFVNDLPYCINHCEISLYADDTVIYFSSNNACDLENKLNSDLKHLCRWFNDNLLTLNVSKCKFVIYGSSSKVAKFDNVSITVNDSILDRIDSFKYLGVTIQQNLTWSEHIDNISKKFNQHLGLIRRIKFLLPKQARLTLYNSLVLPLLDYSDIVWGDKNSILMNNLQVLQHNAARLILDLPRHSSATEALETLEWKPFTYVENTTVVSLSLNVLTNLVDFDFNLTMISHLHSHKTRQNNNYYLPRPRTNWGKQQFTYHSVSEWNSLPIELKQSTNLNLFKSKLKQFI